MAVTKHVIKIICLVFLLFSAYCSRSIPEKEPENNLRKQALKIESGQKISGSYYSPAGTDVDYMYVSVTAPAMIHGNLSAVKGIDSEILFFHKGDAAPFKTVNDNKSSLNERFGPYLIDSPGVVIAVRPLSPLNDEKFKGLKYEFSFELMSPPLPVEQESNDTLEEANEIKENVIRGYYNNSLNNNELERDYYYIELPDQVKYRLSLNLSGVSNIDAVLRLYSRDGEKLLTADDGVVGEEENIFSYGVQGPSRVYFSVNAKDYKVSDSEYYELKASVDKYEDKYELEPNDNIREATPVKVNKIFSDFSNDQDVDYYKYFNDSLETKSIFAEVVPDSNYDIRLELIPGINAKPIVFDDGTDESSEGIANWTIRPLETIYLKVSKNTPGKKRAYTLNFNQNAIAENEEKEPNDSIKKATQIFPQKPMNGYINPKSDVDYYSLKIGHQGMYGVELQSPPECAMTVSVLDNRGIKTEGESAKQVGEKISIQALLDPNGYIMVSCENMKKPQYENPYTLTVTPGE